MTDLQYRILEILYKPNKEDIEYNRFILIEKLKPLIGQDTKLNDSINANINYLNIKNELTKEYILLRKTLGKEGLGISDDNILLNFEELSKACFVDIIIKNPKLINEFRYSDVLLTKIGKQVFEKESNIKNKKVDRENTIYKVQKFSNISGIVTLGFVIVNTIISIFSYNSILKVDVSQLDKIYKEVKLLQVQEMSVQTQSTNQKSYHSKVDSTKN